MPITATLSLKPGVRLFYSSSYSFFDESLNALQSQGIGSRRESRLLVPQTQSAFHPHARTAFRRRDAPESRHNRFDCRMVNDPAMMAQMVKQITVRELQQRWTAVLV
jgi:hypothetical protein